MAPEPDTAASRLDRYVAGAWPSGARPGVTALAGDASDRRYFRIEPPGEPARIAAVYSTPIQFTSLPFAVVQRLFASMPVPVPAIVDHSDELGIVVQEDLGDVTLQAQLAHTSAAGRAALYREAIAIIEVIQRRGAQLHTTTLAPFQLAFDEEKLSSELRFFATHFLEALRGARPTEDDRGTLEQEFGLIAAELAAEPRVVCHRDYHSRNLMCRDGRLYVIDFQDARLGPDTYDLASLVRDAYVDFTEDEVSALIDVFLSVKGADRSTAAAFRTRFDLMATQRTMKALGTFGFQATSRGKTAYLEGVPRTLRVLRTTLTRQPRFDALRRLLAAFVPELQ